MAATSSGMSFPKTLLIAAAIAVVVAAGFYIIGSIRDKKADLHSIVWGPGTCPVVGLKSYRGQLTASCNEREYPVGSDLVKFSYALNPGPLTCHVRKDEVAICGPRPFKPAQPDAK